MQPKICLLTSKLVAHLAVSRSLTLVEVDFTHFWVAIVLVLTLVPDQLVVAGERAPAMVHGLGAFRLFRRWGLHLNFNSLTF